MKDLKELQQDLFNKAWAHANSMDEPSLNSKGKCAYRGKDGAKCLIGALIPDEKYDPHIEGFGVNAGVRRGLGLEYLHPNDKRTISTFLKKIQGAHDFGATPVGCGDAWPLSEWKESMINSLRSIAIEYGLDIPKGAES